MLKRETKVSPGSEVANHGEIDDISVKSFHLYECPSIDEGHVDISNNSEIE